MRGGYKLDTVFWCYNELISSKEESMTRYSSQLTVLLVVLLLLVRIESICGNGVLTGIEECDDGNLVVGDGCNSLCSIENGFICPVANLPCEGICGDGLVKGAETCDDGNTANDDGCSSTCQR